MYEYIYYINIYIGRQREKERDCNYFKKLKINLFIAENFIYYS